MGQDGTVLTGAVVDSARVGIPDVLVSVERLGLQARTNEDGWFRIVVPAGSVVLQFRRLGFEPFEYHLTVSEAAEQIVGTIILSANPVVLEDIVVSEEQSLQRSPALAQIQRMGFGDTMTREEIQRLNPLTVEDLLRRMGSIQFNQQGDPYFFAAPPQVCPDGPTVTVDNVTLPGANALRLIRDPKRQIQTIFTYRGALEKCGVIAIETDPFIRDDPSSVKVGLRAGGVNSLEQVGGQLGVPLSETVELRPGFDVFLADAAGWQAQVAFVFQPDFFGPFFGGVGLGIEKLRRPGSAVLGVLSPDFLALLGVEAELHGLFGFFQIQMVQPNETGLRGQMVAGIGVQVGEPR
ncbi:MAG: carboxypeptidase-like regulatory domain-containing protein [Gemmatimonadota bacterium]|nr:carboxypeptidase-like regulatory domain-containing protein [Gemmatimonadota bacterium]